MADLITKAQVEALLRRLKATADSMTDPSHRACEKCFALFILDASRRTRCYCDYESDRYDS